MNALIQFSSSVIDQHLIELLTCTDFSKQFPKEQITEKISSLNTLMNEDKVKNIIDDLSRDDVFIEYCKKKNVVRVKQIILDYLKVT